MEMHRLHEDGALQQEEVEVPYETRPGRVSSDTNSLCRISYPAPTRYRDRFRLSKNVPLEKKASSARISGPLPTLRVSNYGFPPELGRVSPKEDPLRVAGCPQLLAAPLRGSWR